MAPQSAQSSSALKLYLLCSAQLMVVLDLSIVSVALPALRNDLHFTDQNLQYVISLYALVFGAFLILAGRAADIFGRRRFFTLGAGLFTVASIISGLTSSSTVLLGARVLQGAAAACLVPSALALINTLYTEDSARLQALGVWGAMSAIGGAAGFLLGGFLVDTLGSHSVFFVNACISLIAFIGSPRLLPESREDTQNVNRQSIDVLGAVALAGCLTLFLYGLTRGQQDGFGSPVALGLLIGAVILLVAFIAIERRVAMPLVPLSIFGEGAIGAANLAALTFSAVLAGEGFFASLHLQGILRYSALATGFALLPQNLSGIASSRTASALISRYGEKTVLVLGLVLTGLGCLYLTRFNVDNSYWLDILPGFILFGLGFGTTFVAVTVAATTGVAGSEQGLSSALLTTSQQIGSAIGLALLVTLASSYSSTNGDASSATAIAAGYRAGLFAAACIAGIGVAITLKLMQSQPKGLEQRANGKG